MGQQLLLLVVTTITVGLATLAGIEAYTQSKRQSTINHITQTAIEIASGVQEYAKRPDILRPDNETAAAGEDADLVVDFGELQHYETDDSDYDGDYIDAYAPHSLNVNGTLLDGYSENACRDNNSINIVETRSEEHDASVCGSIMGTSANDLERGWRSSVLDGWKGKGWKGKGWAWGKGNRGRYVLQR